MVKVAERVPKADKLLRLEIDIGTEVRQVLAGIAEAACSRSFGGAESGKSWPICAPRKLRGMESNGMIVAASLEDGKPVLAGFLMCRSWSEAEIGLRVISLGRGIQSQTGQP